MERRTQNSGGALQLFLECDREGNVVWVNETTRNRLGISANLLDSISAPFLQAAQELLASNQTAGSRTLTCSLLRSNHPDPLPVRLVRVLDYDGRVLLLAELQERALDAAFSLERASDLLFELQCKAMRSYSQIWRVQALLEQFPYSERRNIGHLLTCELENERTRIARELHATAGQTLAAIKINADLVRTLLPDASHAVERRLHQIRALADEAMSQVRSISHRLHSPDWQQLSLNEALERLWNSMAIPEKFHATLQLDALADALPNTIRVVLYRLAQEALSNVLRHSEATEVRLSLGLMPDRVQLSVEDNGKGFDPESLSFKKQSAREGLGLRIMREHARMLGGEVYLHTRPTGTQVTVSLPVVEPS